MHWQIISTGREKISVFQQGNTEYNLGQDPSSEVARQHKSYSIYFAGFYGFFVLLCFEKDKEHEVEW